MDDLRVMDDLLRVYLDPSDIGLDGYPYAWHGQRRLYEANGPPPRWESTGPAIKDLVREQQRHRCERCGHPYPPGIAASHPRGEWTPCDRECSHGMPARDLRHPFDDLGYGITTGDLVREGDGLRSIEAQWRILTVHHLNGAKHDCRWWNLAALCQRCHLAIQGKVIMNRVWPWEHSEWFKPHAAGWYAFAYLGEELTREQTITRLDELLELELHQKARLFGEYRIEEE